MKEEVDDYISRVHEKIMGGIKNIEKELMKREEMSKQFIQRIDGKILHIVSLQRQSQFKANQLKKRVETIEGILGKN